MDYLPVKKRIHSNVTLPSPPFIPDEIVSEILCLLPVKRILQLKCVSKTWKTLISDPSFVQKHFEKSSQNSHLLFTPTKLRYPLNNVEYSLSPVLLLDNPSLTVSSDICQVVGTCKGLLCLLFHSGYQNYWFRLWNPATRTLSEKLGTFQDDTMCDSCKFTFGCDTSTGTYKVVALSKVWVREENTLSMRKEFRVLSLGDNCCRTFQFGSSIPVCLIYLQTKRINKGLHLNGTVNWLTLPKYIEPTYKYHWKSIANAQQFVIVSLDLLYETCTQLLLPPDFDELPCFQPTLHVLMDCLCFSHDIKGTEFVIWQMKEFGVQKSWTLLFKTNYADIQMHNPHSLHSLDIIKSYIKIGTHLLPLYLSKNGDKLILTNYEDDEAFVYSEREKRVNRIRIAKKLNGLFAMDYVESLVSPAWKFPTLIRNNSRVCGSMIGTSILTSDGSEIR